MAPPSGLPPNTSRVKRETLGRFEVVYEPPMPWSFDELRSGLANLRESFPYAGRLLLDMMQIATGPFLLYLALSLWLALAPSICISAAYTGVQIVRHLVTLSIHG